MKHFLNLLLQDADEEDSDGEEDGDEVGLWVLSFFPFYK